MAQAAPFAVYEARCQRVRAAFAHAFAAMAVAVKELSDFDLDEVWADEDGATCEQWLTINTGLGRAASAEIVRVARALRDLPLIAAAFAQGRLSLDKVRALTTAALPADEGTWLELALTMSGSQLTRVCREFRRASEADAVSGEQREKRGLWHHWRTDGMLELLAVLPPEDGARILAAIEKVTNERRLDPLAGDDSPAARRADALVDVVTAEAEPGQLIVHVDAEVLAGGAGRCHSESGTPLPSWLAEQMLCDSSLVTILERDGLPVNAGRARRTAPPATKRAMVARDRTCTFPGCLVPALRTPGHHVRRWADGGGTDLGNLASLCGFHHRRHHQGAFRMVNTGGRRFHFERPDGRPILPPPPLGSPPRRRAAGDPRATGGGERLDLGWTVTVMSHNGLIAGP